MELMGKITKYKLGSRMNKKYQYSKNLFATSDEIIILKYLLNRP